MIGGWVAALRLLAADVDAGTAAPPPSATTTSSDAAMPAVPSPSATSTSPSAAPTAFVLVDGVAAVVDRRVLTLREVDLEARIILVRRAGEGGARQALDDDLRRGVLSYLVVQELLAAEARRTPGLLVREADVDKGVATFRARFLEDASYARFLAVHGVDEEELRAVIRRDLLVEALLAKVLGAPEVVADADADAYLAAHPDLAAGAPWDERRQAARDAVRRERRDRRFAAYVEERKRDVDVRLLAPYAAPAPAGSRP